MSMNEKFAPGPHTKYSVSGERPRREKARKEGHDSLLQLVSNKEALIVLYMTGANMVGKLRESDRFTISVYPLIDDTEAQAILRLPSGRIDEHAALIDWSDLRFAKNPVVFFKHALNAFRLIVRPS